MKILVAMIALLFTGCHQPEGNDKVKCNHVITRSTLNNNFLHTVVFTNTTSVLQIIAFKETIKVNKLHIDWELKTDKELLTILPIVDSTYILFISNETLENLCENYTVL